MKKIKYFVLAILVIIGLYSFYLYTLLYGGLGGFIAEHRNPPKEEKLEPLRSDALKELTQAHAELSSLTGLNLYEKTYSDMCVKGRHGWKVSDSYAYICSYRLTYYYGTDREYKELLLDFEKILDDLEWKNRGSYSDPLTISEAINQYSGEIFLVELPVYRKKVSDNYIFLTINSFNGYDENWVMKSKEPDPFRFGIGIRQDIYSDESNKSPEEIFMKITSSGQEPIMIAISTVYFEN